jgi:hypothetical protein
MIGDMPANWPAQSGVEPGWVLNDFNWDYPDVLAPYGSPNLPPVYVNGANNTNYTLSTYDYYVPGDFTMGKKDVMEVTGNARLYATGDMTLTTVIIDSGSSLKVYVGMPTGTGNNGTFDTVGLTNNAANFQVYGLPSMSSLTLNGNATFLGCFYAPEAALTMNGSGNNLMDYEGSCVVQSITLNGRFNLHFDENLRRNGPASGFTLASWTEL